MGGRGASSSAGGGGGSNGGGGGGGDLFFGNGEIEESAFGKGESTGNPKWDDFRDMNRQQLSDLVQTMRMRPNSYYYEQGLNAGNPTQRLVTELGINDKPLVLDDAAYDKLIADNPNMIQIYRGVRGNGNLSADDVRKQTMYGDKTYVGDGIHGDGLYFATDSSTAYGYAGRNGAIMQAVINPAKVKAVKEDDLRRMYNNDSRNYNPGTFRDISQYALYKGYNTIIAPGGNGSLPFSQGGEDYYVPIDRSVLIMRKTAKGY